MARVSSRGDAVDNNMLYVGMILSLDAEQCIFDGIVAALLKAAVMMEILILSALKPSPRQI